MLSLNIPAQVMCKNRKEINRHSAPKLCSSPPLQNVLECCYYRNRWPARVVFTTSTEGCHVLARWTAVCSYGTLVFLTASTLWGPPRPFGGTAASRLNCTGCSIAHICCCRTTQVKMSQTDSHPARRPSRVQQTFVRVLWALALEKKSRPTAPKILLQIWRFDLHIFGTNNLQTKRSITWQ